MQGRALRIGAVGWLDHFRALSEACPVDPWAAFSPCSASEIARLEEHIARRFDAEFTEFYRTVGCGQFPFGGGFDSPEDIAAEFDAAIYFVTGSLTHGREWATAEDHRLLWTTRGVRNPNPRLFTEEALLLDGIHLYDLMQFGSDGSGAYHQLYVGPEPAPIRYCLLVDSQSIEGAAGTFSEAVESIVTAMSEIEEEG